MRINLSCTASTGRIELESVWQTNLSVYSRVKANVVRAA